MPEKELGGRSQVEGDTSQWGSHLNRGQGWTLTLDLEKMIRNSSEKDLRGRER